jgi:hydroxymethylpyrimidine/phosphomethylpyrimidine kinase
MVATSGALLLDPDALDAMVGRLVPLATIITPNIPEAEVLLGHAIADAAAAQAALDELLALDAHAVLLKGGHLLADTSATDYYADRDARAAFTHDRLNLHAHGTGCTLAAAITANSCLGRTLLKACEAAIEYVHGALVHGYHPGESDVAVLDHFWRSHAVPND